MFKRLLAALTSVVLLAVVAACSTADGAATTARQKAGVAMPTQNGYD